MHYRRPYLGILLAGLLGGLPFSHATPAAGTPPDAAGLAAVAAQAQQACGAPGLALALYTPERGLEQAASGLAAVDSGVAVDADDLFCIGSITKTFVAVCVLQAVGEGRLKLDQPAVDYLPHPALNPALTIRQLLNHTSGIYDFQDLQPALPRWMLALALTQQYTPQQVVDFCLKHEPYFAPGQGYHYSNTNYFVLGLILEGLEGELLPAIIHRRILDPLGLTQTYFGGYDALPASPLHGYGLRGGRLEDRTGWENASLAWAAGAMVSNAPDLLNFASALFEGRLLAPELLAEMRVGVERPRNGRYGLGLMLVPTASGEIEGHEGMTLGFRAGMWHLRAPEVYAVVLTNQVDCNIFAAYETVLTYATERAR